jgi:hypothetical protein
MIDTNVDRQSAMIDIHIALFEIATDAKSRYCSKIVEPRMNALLEDPLNLKILEFLCSGIGIIVNINELSKRFKRHRNTIKTKINSFF